MNPNYASREVLRALPGWDDTMAAATVAARSVAPFQSIEELQDAVPAVSAMAHPRSRVAAGAWGGPPSGGKCRQAG